MHPPHVSTMDECHKTSCLWWAICNMLTSEWLSLRAQSCRGSVKVRLGQLLGVWLTQCLSCDHGLFHAIFPPFYNVDKLQHCLTIVLSVTMWSSEKKPRTTNSTDDCHRTAWDPEVHFLPGPKGDMDIVAAYKFGATMYTHTPTRAATYSTHLGGQQS